MLANYLDILQKNMDFSNTIDRVLFHIVAISILNFILEFVEHFKFTRITVLTDAFRNTCSTLAYGPQEYVF